MSWFKKYLTREIAIEFKTCMYFFYILFFYSMYLVVHKTYSVPISILAEIIFTTYTMGYLQVYLLWNFDEAECLGKREWIGITLCTVLYTVISWLFDWFQREIGVMVIFAVYMALGYICIFSVYKIKRDIDTKELNHMLSDFKKRGM